jgi:putative CocE/NonD family hydrolase
MDNGGGNLGPGALQPVWEMDFDAWPPKTVQATDYYLGPHGTLGTSAPAANGSDHYTGDPSARPLTSLPDGANAWAAQPGYQWKPVVDGKGLGYISAPLAHDVVIAGPSSLDLMLASSARDTDLQVTLSEVRPDGKETYVQFGELRASYRKPGPNATPLQPMQTFTSSDQSFLTPNQPVPIRVPLFPVAYAFRAGSRIRITIQAPGGERPSWMFDTIEKGTTTNTISWSAAVPSMLVLPVVPGQSAGAPLPACGAPRGQPCRDYVAASNGG